MKKFLLLCVFSVACFLSRAQTNIYHPFPGSNTNWNIDGIVPWACPFNTDYYESFSIIISGDTTIGNYDYHKLSIPVVQRSCTSAALHFPGYAGAFRDDTSAKKIFFVYPNDSAEQLLYDFTMQVGDTIKGYLSNYWMCMPNAQVVNSIDSVLVGSSYRKMWVIGNGWFRFIEGIGSTAGLLDPVCEIIDGPICSLLCFSLEGTVLYPANAAQCNVVMDLNDAISENRNHISIFPNPFHSEAQLENGVPSGIRGIENGLLRIYNAMGMLVREDKILNLNSYILRRDGLNDGLYFYELRASDSDLIGSGKFLVE